MQAITQTLTAGAFAKIAISLALALALPAQERGDPPPKPETTKQKPAKKLDAWPELAPADVDRVLASLGQFRKKNEKLHATARQQLIRIGAAAAPMMLQKISDRPGGINDHVFAVLDEVLKPTHAALIAREIKKPTIRLRRYLTRRLSTFLDPDMRPVLLATAKDADPETAYYAALGALALGEKDALPRVLTYSKAKWHEVRETTATVLTKARCNEKGSWVFEAIAKARAADQMAGLRLARYLAVKDHNVILRGYLKSSDHAVKKEAINALRVIHGEEPLEELSVFEAIGHAQKWMKRI